MFITFDEMHYRETVCVKINNIHEVACVTLTRIARKTFQKASEHKLWTIVQNQKNTKLS